MRSKKIALIILLSLGLISCGAESDIREACRDYLSGRIALRSGDSTKLEAVTTDSLYVLLKLNQDYLNLMKDVPHFKADLDISPKKIEINNDKATSFMNGDEYYKIHLKKINNNWVVEGENDQFTFGKSIREVKKKIKDYKEFLKDKPARDSVLNSLQILISGVKSYFIKQDIELLESVCTPSSLGFIKNLYSYALQRTGKEILLQQLEIDKYPLFDVFFEKDKIIVKLYQDPAQLTFQKINGNYKFTGANGLEAKAITSKLMNLQYLSLLRVLKITTNKAEKEGLVK